MLGNQTIGIAGVAHYKNLHILFRNAVQSFALADKDLSIVVQKILSLHSLGTWFCTNKEGQVDPFKNFHGICSDFINARIKNKSVPEVITDQQWLEGDFISTIQKRGAEIIEARGKSSAASAANAIIGTMRALLNPSEEAFSVALCSDENPYGIQRDLIFSFPCITKEEGEIEIVKDVSIDYPFLKKKIAETEKELLEERDAISHLL